MAPLYNRMDESSLGKQITKLRKPVIEKMRRDRINSSIDQLRILLHKEFPQQQHLPSRAEKAEILEMAVTLLRQQIQRVTIVASAADNDFPTLKEGRDFLPLETQINVHATSHECHVSGPSTWQPNNPSQGFSTADLWRPW
ncbi:transcription factor HES-5-like [Pelodytes ibericus]